MNSVKMLPVLLAVSLIVFSIVTALPQSVGVRGQIMCGNFPLPDTEVTIWQYLADPETSGLATTKSDASGYFSLSATVDSTMQLQPVVRIYPSCSSDQALLGKPSLCQREATYFIPPGYISTGATIYNWYQMGTINMQVKQQNEQIQCSPSPFQGVNNVYGYITD